MHLKFSILWAALCMSILGSCSKPEIPLDKVRATSDLLHCDKVFGTTLKNIEEENEIIVQTGEIDTTDEQKPVRAAIVRIKNREVVLNLSENKVSDNKTMEAYNNNDYTLMLSYLENPKGIYNGTCTITSGKLKSIYDLVGINNKHL